ncbi:MAG TPA: gamma carbonic anhydrase family protein [Oligoflexia bacterium]|nr:gamma carbonic anhydrase family protein [Oligoflexia bacterium]HMP48233.1 gamma carbonic anhydrase family protein [Oligoflexia bacterium]
MITGLYRNGAHINPEIVSPHFIAPDATLIGDVKIGKEVSIFFGAVLRGDLEPVRVGDKTNIQEHSMLHTTRGRSPCEIGSGVTVGHRAIIHGANVGSNCLIGMGSIILDDSKISEHSLVGAGSLVTEGKVFPPRSLILGSPAVVIRELSDKEIDGIINAANAYIKTGQELAQALGV